MVFQDDFLTWIFIPSMDSSAFWKMVGYSKNSIENTPLQSKIQKNPFYHAIQCR